MKITKHIVLVSLGYYRDYDCWEGDGRSRECEKTSRGGQESTQSTHPTQDGRRAKNGRTCQTDETGL